MKKSFWKNRTKRKPAHSTPGDKAAVASRLKFAYEPLDQRKHCIRLLRVESTLNNEGRIVCSMVNASTKLSYRALSYTWGPADEKHTIMINAMEFSVRRNLWEFLNSERECRSDLPLWIDAVSIDQSNIPERNSQVKHMGSVYSNAQHVVVWLGSVCQPSQVRPVVTLSRILRTGGQPLTTTLFPKEEEIQLLFNNAYWSRVWIVQEMTLARSVVLKDGVEELVLTRRQLRTVWSLLHPAALEMLAYDTHTSFGRVCRWLQSQQSDNATPTLGAFLEHFIESECSDPRDKVYAALSLVQKGDRFLVDYELDVMTLHSRAWNFFRQGAGDDSEWYALHQPLTEALLPFAA